MTVNFIGEDAETFTAQWSVPSVQQDQLSLPLGVQINCTSSDQEVILNRNLTQLNTTLKLDLSKTIICCLSAALTIECFTYDPKINHAASDQKPGSYRVM